MKRVILSSLILVAALIALPGAQMRVVPLDDEQGHVAFLSPDRVRPRIRITGEARAGEPLTGDAHRALDLDARTL